MKGWDEVSKRLNAAIRPLEQHLKSKDTRPRRSLRDEVDGIASTARLTERLTASGCGPTAFAATLAANNESYRVFDAAQREGQSYSDAMKEAGVDVGKKFLPKSCVVDAAPVRPHRQTDEDWAATCNRVGSEIRRGR